MDRRHLLSVIGAGVVAGGAAARATESDKPAPLGVRIVPTHHREKVGRSLALGPNSPCFHVVVTNASGEPIRLWREWCSWGYFNLSFEVTDLAGQAATVRKRERSWSKNYPDWEIIPPGDHQVWDVTLDPATWLEPPLPDSHGPKAVRMKAIYSVRPDEKSEEYGVWTGVVTSPEEAYTLWY